MSRANMVKFILLLSIALGLLALLIYSQFSTPENDEFEINSGYVHTNLDKEKTLVNENGSHDVEEKEEKKVIVSNTHDTKKIEDANVDEFDFETHIQQRTGEKAYKLILQNASKAMNLLAVGENKEQEWKGISTTSFMERLQIDEVQLLSYSKIDSLEIFPTKQINEEDVIIGAIIEANDDLKSYQLIFKKQQGRYFIDDIVLMWSN